MSTIPKVANNKWGTIGLCRLDLSVLPAQNDLRAREQLSDLQASKMVKVWRIDLDAYIRLADRNEAAYFTC